MGWVCPVLRQQIGISALTLLLLQQSSPGSGFLRAQLDVPAGTTALPECSPPVHRDQQGIPFPKRLWLSHQGQPLIMSVLNYAC